MPPRKRNGQKRSGSDRFGYRPTPEKYTSTGLYPYQVGQTDRQRLLDKVKFQKMADTWRQENLQKGREGWNDFGNKALPIEKYKHDIMKMVAANRISLLAGETGSGKSTQLAQYALEMGYDHIVYLEPRRVTTDGVAERVDAELTEQFEQKKLEKPEHLVGMAHSDHTTLCEDSVIQVMTSAVFKKRAPELQEDWKDKKVLIVADEVHEGNIETEFAVAMSAEMMTEQPNWNMVLMSATMNEEEIQQAYTPINGKPIPKIEVEGRPHEIEYNEVPDKNVVDVFEESCLDGNKTIIFTEGQRAMGAIENELRRRQPNVRILKLHSKITDDERREIFHKEVPGVHTVIISTSAGQSGLTIPGVDRVISDGMTKSPELDDENAEGLPSRLCSQAEITQQMGRGGRDIDGAKFFLAQQLPFKKASRDIVPQTFVTLSEREMHAPADIYHTVITRNVLSAAAMGRDFYNLNGYLIHKVSYDTIEEAYQVLRMLGAVNKENEVTPVGKLMDMFPLRPELARAVAEAMQSGTKQQQRQVAAIAAAVEAGGLSSGDPERIRQNQEKLPAWAKDDFMAELAYFSQLKLADSEVVDGDENAEHSPLPYNLDFVNSRRARKQFRKLCQRMGIEMESEDFALTDEVTPDSIDEVKDMFVKGMPHLLYEKVGQRKHRGRMKKMPDGSKVRPAPIVYYRNILGPHKDEAYEYDRTLSNRSVMGKVAVASSDLIAGYPRWYIDDDGERHDVVERGFAVNKERVKLALGSVAMAVRKSTVVGRDGRLRAITSRTIGSLQTGREVADDVANTREKAALLVEKAIRQPGSAQLELRELKRAVQDLASRVPQARKQYYFERPPISQQDFEDMLFWAAEGAVTTGQLDAALRNNMYENHMQLSSFIAPDKLDDIIKNMPTTTTINDWTYDIKYTDDGEARPYITDLPPNLAWSLPETFTIPDGREIFLRYNYGDGDDRYLTVADVRAMSENEL